MKVYKKIISAVLAVLLLAGCSGNQPPETEQTDSAGAAEVNMGTEEALAESTGEAETPVTDEADEEVTDEDEPDGELSDPETEKPSGKKAAWELTVTSADQLYEVYPTRLICPEKQETDIIAEKAVTKETIYQGDIPIVEFSAEYPVFSGDNETAIKKINDSIKAHIDSILDEERLDAESFEINEEFNEHIMSVYGFYWQRWINAGNYTGYKRDCYDINGNILSVFFMDYTYGAGAAHGYETPVPMVFDLRTGDRVDFNNIAEEKRELADKVRDAIYMYLDRESVEKFEEYFISWSEDDQEKDDRLYNLSEDGRMEIYSGSMVIDDVIRYVDLDSRLTVRDGCIGYYLNHSEYGPYAAGIRLVQLPVTDVLNCLNDDGKALFEGYASAEAEPVKVIEYKGERYFSTNSLPNFDGSKLTDEDYEFISCFDDADVRFRECRNIDYNRLAEADCIEKLYIKSSGDIDYNKLAEMDRIKELTLSGYDNIDVSAIAKMKGLEELTLYSCSIDDISPLYGSGIKYIYGDSPIITKSQAEEFLNSGGEYVGGLLIIRQ